MLFSPSKGKRMSLDIPQWDLGKTNLGKEEREGGRQLIRSKHTQASRVSLATSECSLVRFGLSLTCQHLGRPRMMSPAHWETRHSCSQKPQLQLLGVPSTSSLYFSRFKNTNNPEDMFKQGFPNLTQNGASTWSRPWTRSHTSFLEPSCKAQAHSLHSLLSDKTPDLCSWLGAFHGVTTRHHW